MYQQGDVLFKKCADVNISVLKEDKSGIIMYGEATGHSHRLVRGGKLLLADNGQRYVHVADGDLAYISHEEHNLRMTMANKMLENMMTEEDMEYLKEIGVDTSLPTQEMLSRIPTELILPPGLHEDV